MCLFEVSQIFTVIGFSFSTETLIILLMNYVSLLIEFNFLFLEIYDVGLMKMSDAV